MGFLEDAQAFMQSKQSTDTSTPWDPTDDKTYADLFNDCRHLYENATKTEIERAINRTLDELDKPYDKKQFMKKIRVYLED